MTARVLAAASILALSSCAAQGPATPAPSAPAAPASAPPAATAFAHPTVAALPPIDPAAMPKQRAVVLSAARYFDGKSDAVVDGGVTLVVENGLIVRVGKRGSFAPPADADAIDLGDATLMPGFIDAHTHVTGESSPDYYRYDFEARHRFPAEQTLYAASYAKTLLMAGFTTVRDLGSHDAIDLGLRNGIEKGLVPGPRMLVSLRSLGATGGHSDGDTTPPDRVPERNLWNGPCDGADACMKAVRLRVKYGADVIKVHASGGVLSLGDAVDSPQLTLDEMKAIVGEAHRLGKKVAAHCHGDTAAKVAIEAGVDSIEHGSFLKPDTLALMKKKGTVLVPTLLASEWLASGENSAKYPPPIRAKIQAATLARSQMFKDALKAGVVIGFGTDSAVSPHGINAREFSLMTGLGMSPAAALRSAMSVDAELLGIAKQTGTLEPAKLGDVVAVRGNPVADIKATEQVVFVMRAGVVYKRP